MLAARDALATPFGVINADDFYGRDAFRVLAENLNRRRTGTPDEYAMVGFRLGNTLSEHGPVARGICEAGRDDWLIAVEELTGIEKTATGARHAAGDGSVRQFIGSELVSMNMWGFTPSIFGHLDERFRVFLGDSGSEGNAEFFVPTVVNDLIAEQLARVRVLRTDGSWFGVTYRGDLPRVLESVREFIDKGVYPRELWGEKQA